MGVDQIPESKMRIVMAPSPGGPGVLKVCHRPRREPGPGQVGITTVASGVNRPDVLERQGAYPPPQDAPEGLGLEVSGHVTALGAGVEGWRTGDRVCALVSGGGYADYAIADASHVLPAPANLPLEHAAALPEAVFTVWANLFEAGRLTPTDRVLIHGGASGIGVMAIQMARAHGAEVAATARSDEKCALCRDLGADPVINSAEHDFAPILKNAGGVDVILDMVGAPFIQSNLNVLRTDGRLVQIAFAAGASAQVNFTRLMLKRLTLTGSVLRSRSAGEKARLARAVRRHVWPWVEAGRVTPVIDSEFPLDAAAKAHERMESGAHRGKILLRP